MLCALSHPFFCFCIITCTTGCSSTDLTPIDAVGLCADREFVNILPIPSGVVCYNRTTAGSEAVYICNDGFHQNGTSTRVCQKDDIWNGSIPQCFSDQRKQEGIIMYLTDIIIEKLAEIIIW